MKDSASKISVIVPFRVVEDSNFAEYDSFAFFLNSLKKVTPFVCEVILVNDHSSPKALELARSLKEENWKILDLSEDEIGKKEALLIGIQEATSEYIWTLDADVSIDNFNSNSFHQFQRNLEEDIVILPVEMNGGKGLLEIFQVNEWRLLQWLTRESARLNFPMMCNGANLIFRRDVFLDNIFLHKTISSGDDLFLLSEVMRKKGKIGLSWSSFSCVAVYPEPNLRRAISQRIRWAGKTTKLPISKSTVFHFAFAFISACHIIALCGIVVAPSCWILGFFLILKLVVEMIGVFRVFSKPTTFFEGAVLVPQLLLYPVFSLSIFISSLFYKPKWKQRRVSLR